MKAVHDVGGCRMQVLLASSELVEARMVLGNNESVLWGGCRSVISLRAVCRYVWSLVMAP
eukprot:12920424-Prorocentrum_lima.AAC.1